MESAELGIFMVSACVFTTLLEYPRSPLNYLLPNSFLRRALIGMAMALTLLLFGFAALANALLLAVERRVHPR